MGTPMSQDTAMAKNAICAEMGVYITVILWNATPNNIMDTACKQMCLSSQKWRKKC